MEKVTKEVYENKRLIRNTPKKGSPHEHENLVTIEGFAEGFDLVAVL